jgi:DNA gyrase inhibitor GyrI
MKKQNLLHVEVRELSPLQVAHKLCIFPTGPKNHDKKIRKTFQTLRDWITGFGLDPDTLLHVGIPMLDNKGLITYDCCIEFPLPIDDEGKDIQQKSLEGGTYAILRIEKKPNIIAKSIRQFKGDYIVENEIIIDEDRPVYEIYFKDIMEYCVPILE